MDTKTCAFCAVEKSVNEFYRMKTAKDGRQSYCKPCARLYRSAKIVGARRVQAGCAYTQAREDLLEFLRTGTVQTLADLLVVLKRPKVHGMLRQINLAEIIADLKCRQDSLISLR